jgi:uncharacterized membrane protein
MRSRAALAGHPLHPAMVAIPIGAFTVALVGDVVSLLGGAEGWAEAAGYAILIGLAGALLAAALGFVDYFGVTMSPAAHRLATIHMLLNLTAVVLYAASAWLRTGEGPTPGLAILLATVGYLILAGSGWLGGELAFKHKVGVVEDADPEATAIGQRESAARRP